MKSKIKGQIFFSRWNIVWAVFFVWFIMMVAGLDFVYARTNKEYDTQMAAIHQTVYQDAFDHAKLSQAIKQCQQWLQTKKTAELFLYQAKAHYRLEQYLAAFVTAQKGLQWQQEKLANLSKQNALYGYHETMLQEIQAVLERAQARLELQIYHKKIHKK